jgi:hypothetical protein
MSIINELTRRNPRYIAFFFLCSFFFFVQIIIQMVKWFKKLAAFPNNRLIQSLPKSFSLNAPSTSSSGSTSTDDRPISSLFDSSHDTKSTEPTSQTEEEPVSPSSSGSKLSLEEEEHTLQAVSHTLLLLNTILGVPLFDLSSSLVT